jgi:hypothetical protein
MPGEPRVDRLSLGDLAVLENGEIRPLLDDMVKKNYKTWTDGEKALLRFVRTQRAVLLEDDTYKSLLKVHV